MALQVGQELWMVPSEARYRDQARLVRVEKVGRKWADLDCYGRVNMETMALDGGGFSSHGRCYVSKEAWEAEEKRATAWRILSNEIGRMWQAPDCVTIETMEQIRKLLGQS